MSSFSLTITPEIFYALLEEQLAGTKRLCKSLSFGVLEEHKGILATALTEKTLEVFIKHSIFRLL